MLAEALAAARELPDMGLLDSPRACALAALAPNLPPNLLPRAIDVARELRDADARAQALASLAPHLLPELLADALDIAREIGDADARAQTLAALAPHMPEDLREQTLREALAAARGLPETVLFSARA